MGYRDDDFYVPVLFYADDGLDGLLLARSCGEPEDMIEMVIPRGSRRVWVEYK